MISKLGLQLLIGLLPLLQTTLAEFHGDVCNQNAYCNKEAGLICSFGRCACSDGPLNAQYSFNLVWNSTSRMCVGQRGSACVGTRRTSVPTGMKAVPCVDDFTCIQIKDMPMGIGSCQLVKKIQWNGAQCDEQNYCDSYKSLICTNGSCACATFRQNTSPQFELVWDDELNNCVAPINKPCISTKESPVAPGHKSIECTAEVECVSVAGQTPGVGVCQSVSGMSGVEKLHNQKMLYLLVSLVVCIFTMNQI